MPWLLRCTGLNAVHYGQFLDPLLASGQWARELQALYSPEQLPRFYGNESDALLRAWVRLQGL